MSTHILTVGNRQARAIITESPAAIIVALEFSGGRFYERHRPALCAWLFPILAPFDSDPRPLKLVDTAGGRSAFVFDVGQGTAVLINP